MPTISDTITANTSKRFNVSGKYFALLSATVAPTHIRFFNRFAVMDEVEGLEAGLKYTGDINAVEISAGALPCTMQFYLGENDLEYNRGAASVDVISLPVPANTLTQTAPAVGVASASILAANAARRFLMVQNNDPAANVFLNLAGAAATVAGGVKLAPGASLLLDVCTPSAEIFAISDAVLTGSVVVVEG